MLEAKKKAKENQEAAKAAKCAAQTCSVDSCGTFTCIEGGAKGWFHYTHCNKLFCKKHKAKFNTPTANCSPEATSNLMDTVVAL